MDNAASADSKAPKCVCGQTQRHELVATVVAGFWRERRFYECAECKGVFADDWSDVR
jgi:hypothetical protein